MTPKTYKNLVKEEEVELVEKMKGNSIERLGCYTSAMVYKCHCS